ncbi:MAG: glycoside hydrolase family 65 protein [Paludibacteraceae bacterium]|nr:glycoside hydrolase family 65 protein [Paludibacteraceae bacterium]
MKKLSALFILAVSFIMLLSAQDPWLVQCDNPLDGEYYGITSANGQIGLKSSRSPLQVEKVVVGGLYDIYGSGRVSNYFENINPLDVELRVDGVRISKSNIDDYKQQMNLRNSAFTGSFSFSGKLSAEYTTMALRQMPYGFMTDVRLVAEEECDVRVVNQHRAPEVLRDPHACFSSIDNKANPFTETYPSYRLMTTTAKSPTGRYDIAATTAFLFPDNQSEGTPYEVRHSEDRGVGRQTMEFTRHLAAGDTLHFCLVGNIIASNVVPDTRNEAERLTVFQLLEGYDRLMARHNAAWEKLWESDILIDGDNQAQQDIHSMLYHLYAFFREGNAASCSPMGLSGLGYNGHNFWDGETWMFPALLLMHPDMARDMLQYRFNLLPQARQKAYMHGYKGALYPWESAHTGQEETAPNNMYPCAEHHVTGDVAIACWQYYCITQDKQWLQTVGWPIISEVADFWVSRTEKDGTIVNLIGADEWNSNEYGGKQTDNNAYTVGVAKTCLKQAALAAKAVGEKPRQEWADTEKLLYFNYMDDGLIAEHATYKGDVTKQADVALLAYPLHILTDKSEIRRNVEYYIQKVPEKRTPAMSKSIYAVLYSRLGEAEKALCYWRDSYLPNLNPPFRVIAEFNGGTNPYFLTGAGGTLQALLFGFAGLDITDKGLKLAYRPVIPSEWKSLTIKRAGEKDLVISNK